MPPILAFEKISKRFGAVVVANEIDLALAEGEALGIIGPNGAGKTTLFGIASGTVQPDAGRVVFAGADITRLPPERRCRLGIGRSFQIPQPFSGMTVFENLVVAAAFGGGQRRARGLSALRRAARAMRRSPTRPTGPPAALTLLDRKRLELARALATQPRVLLLDEVAGGLTEHECARAGRADQATSARRRLDHLDRARRACADRRRRPAGGAARRRASSARAIRKTVIHTPAVREIYMGIPADA